MSSRVQVKIVAVGKLREAYWRDAEAEYRKRLGTYTTKLTIVEVADEPTPDGAFPAQDDEARRREADRVLAGIGEREYVIVLDSAGRSFDSPAFAAHLERLTGDGDASAFTFVIGGSLGLHETVKARANLTLSFGAFTLPHQLMRIVLLEQIYRAFKIQRGEPYHK
jgi:23S rRNA (pseudouridine1915-N3)-methyltransferase